MTLFDKPQFQLSPDIYGIRNYGNVSNALEVATHRGTHHVALAVPTGLFLIMQEILKIPPEDEVLLSLDQLEDRYVFSLLQGASTLIDLWMYSQSTLPAWIMTPAYIVNPSTPTQTLTNIKG